MHGPPTGADHRTAMICGVKGPALRTSTTPQRFVSGHGFSRGAKTRNKERGFPLGVSLGAVPHRRNNWGMSRLSPHFPPGPKQPIFHRKSCQEGNLRNFSYVSQNSGQIKVIIYLTNHGSCSTLPTWTLRKHSNRPFGTSPMSKSASTP